MAEITINDKKISVQDGITVLQACTIAGFEIPRFCYHDRLSIAGNCRMCLVEISPGPPKPIASCAMAVNEGMVIKTDSEMVKKAREGVMEFLLANHPLDCPICDQGGECDLQDQAYSYGKSDSRFYEEKRAVKDKYLSPLIKTHMTRCIHCSRCVRFMDEVAGTSELGLVSRGENVEVISFLEKTVSSKLSGNIIDLCPVGALTAKPYAFKYRNWELTKTPSIDVMDATGSAIRIDSRNMEVMRILPEINEGVNEEWISDKTRFAYDGLKYQRLDKPYIKNNGKLIPCSFEDAYMKIISEINSIRSQEMLALVGNLSAIEEIWALKKLFLKLGCSNLECRIEEEYFDNTDRASYLFNLDLQELEQVDHILIIGCNVEIDSPIINSRIRKAFKAGCKITLIGEKVNLNYQYDYLGDNIKILQDIYDGTSSYATKIRNAKKPAMIMGVDLFRRKDARQVKELTKAIAEKYNIVNKERNAYCVLQRNAARAGALDLGFTLKTKKENLNSILKRCIAKEIKLVWLLNCDEIDTDKLKNSFVIYQGHHGDAGASVADVILPGCSYVEKDGLYVNTLGNAQEARKAIQPPGQAREDWSIILDIAGYYLINMGFENLNELREDLFKHFPHLNPESHNYKNQWIKGEKENIKFVLDEKTKIKNKKIDFYKTNVISKNSKTMNKCSKEMSL